MVQKFGHTARDDPSCQQDPNSLLYAHFPPPIRKFGGKSAILSCRSFTSIFSAFIEFLKAKSSAATSLPLFQFLNSTLYCGCWATSLEVTTNLHGKGRSPCAIQICQSTSSFRNARKSHSAPWITPLPRSLE